jgi:hypothetical protein
MILYGTMKTKSTEPVAQTNYVGENEGKALSFCGQYTTHDG